jgi:hypothetical protein
MQPTASAVTRHCDDMLVLPETDTAKADEMAVRQLHALREHIGPQEKKLRFYDVKEIFVRMRDDP